MCFFSNLWYFRKDFLNDSSVTWKTSFRQDHRQQQLSHGNFVNYLGQHCNTERLQQLRFALLKIDSQLTVEIQPINRFVRPGFSIIKEHLRFLSQTCKCKFGYYKMRVRKAVWSIDFTPVLPAPRPTELPGLMPRSFIESAFLKQFGDPGKHMTGVRETFDWMIQAIAGKQLPALSRHISCFALHASWRI